jgi:hypothetical protein
MTAKVEPHKVLFRNGGELRFDRKDGIFRAAYYYDNVHADGKRYRDRLTATAATIKDMALAVFNLDRPDDKTRELIDYIHSTEWGKDYP